MGARGGAVPCKERGEGSGLTASAPLLADSTNDDGAYGAGMQRLRADRRGAASW
jgi:hypothetical protein